MKKSPANTKREVVVLLHGLALRRWAMIPIARRLRREGYTVLNLSYPSRTVPIEKLAAEWLPARIAAAKHAPATKIHFVTHSMGGIILRLYRRDAAVHELGRVVMLAPPNHGSALVDHMKGFPPFRWVTGVNGRKLGTDRGSILHQLPTWTHESGELGIIAGDRSMNPLFSWWLKGHDDGKVAVRSTKLEGMTDHIVMHHSHTWMQWHADTARQIISFLRVGKFLHEEK